MGRSLKRAHCKRNLVTAREQAAHKLPRTQGSVPSLERIPRFLQRQHCSDSNKRYYGSVLHKQRRRHQVGHTLCSSMENLDLVHQQSSNPQSPTHPRPAECGSRQAIQIRPDYSDRMVPPSRGLPGNMQQVALASDRPVCHQIQQQTASICVSSTGSHGHCSGRCQSVMGRSVRLCLPTSHFGQSGGEVTGHSMQEANSGCSRVA